MYLFEHLLMRLGKSGYAEAFVLKGGLLISSMTGVAQIPHAQVRAPVRVLVALADGLDPLEGVFHAVGDVHGADGGDGLAHRVFVHIHAYHRRVHVHGGPLGDARHRARGRDYYDIHTLLRLKADEINRDSLHEAVVATASRRGSLGKMGDYEAVLGEVRIFVHIHAYHRRVHVHGGPLGDARHRGDEEAALQNPKSSRRSFPGESPTRVDATTTTSTLCSV